MIDLSPFEQYIIFDKKSFILFVKTIFGSEDKDTLRSLFKELNEHQQAYLNYALSKAYSAIVIDNPFADVGGDLYEE